MTGTTFVIVHGAWGSSAAWTPVAEFLRARGHRVFTPSLTGLGERRHLFSGAINLSTHIADVAGTIESEGLTRFVLAAHSYGGMVATGIADRYAERISHIAYLDAYLPGDGQSLLDLVGEEGARLRLNGAADGDGFGIPPSIPDDRPIAPPYRHYAERRTPQPLGTYVQRLRLSNGGYAAIGRRLYVRCGAFASGAFDTARAMAEADPSWRTVTLDCGHSLQLEMPEETAAILADFAGS